LDVARVSGLEPAPVESVIPIESRRPKLTIAGVRPATDEAAGLYEAWAHRVRGYVAFRVRDVSDAEDLVSDVFSRVVSGPVPTESAARPAWIFRVAHNVVVDYYRRRRLPFPPAVFVDRVDDAPSLPDRVIHNERMRATDEAMRHLPGRQRAAIYLRFYEDLPYETVAVAMGIPAVTARSLVHRGLKRLAAALGEETDR
jgi:RNA polymerase sigma-70 factor, ECF subfamily